MIQETRLFDSQKGVTFAMRSKEEAHDYRYFPDPDLLPVVVEREYVENIRASLPELPEKKLERFATEFSLPRKRRGRAFVLKAPRGVLRGMRETREGQKGRRQLDTERGSKGNRQ